MKKLILIILAVLSFSGFLITDSLLAEPLHLYFNKISNGQIDDSIIPTTLLLLMWLGISVFFVIAAKDFWKLVKQ